MSEPLGPGLRATVRRIAKATVAPTQLRLLPYFLGPFGQKCVADALGHAVGDQAGEVRELISRTEHKLLFIKETSGRGAPPLEASVVTKELAARFSDGQLTAGDALLTVNPFTYFTGEAKDRSGVVQHALWHVFLNKIFPGLAEDVAKMRKATGAAPYFTEYFLDPYSHFFMRVAAMEARCVDFAIDDAVRELGERVPAINRLKPGNLSLLQGAALFSGLLFSHVFNFALFPEAGLSVSNYDGIKRFMGQFMAPELIERTEDFSRRLFQDSLIAGQDVSMNGHYRRVMSGWQRFASAAG